MRNILLFLISILVTSCYTSYKLVPKTQNYSESISYTIDKVEEGKSIAVGGGSYHVNKGCKFVFVFLTFKNSLDKKQKLNFEDFILLNPRTKTKHKPEWSMIVSAVNIFANIDSSIEKGDMKKRKLVYILPEEDKASLLMVNDKIIELEYLK